MLKGLDGEDSLPVREMVPYWKEKVTAVTEGLHVRVTLNVKDGRPTSGQETRRYRREKCSVAPLWATETSVFHLGSARINSGPLDRWKFIPTRSSLSSGVEPRRYR